MKIERIKITGARAPVFHLFFIHLPRDRDKIVSCLMVFSPAKAGFSIYCYFIFALFYVKYLFCQIICVSLWHV